MERRLAAILAADVVGYSRLMGADEAGTLAHLKRLRAEVIEPKIKESRGRIVGSAGDSLLVEFASAVHAVQCAVEAQEGLAAHNASLPEDKRMAFRMGVNLGDVIAQDDTIYGDGVNIAARLEKLAEPGGICVASNVYEQVKGKLDYNYTDLGSHQVHNIMEAVRAYRVSRAKPTSVFSTRDMLALPDKPSIAVLPFDNMSGDPEQGYFADGMVEEIITALSRTRWLFVIARNSSFTYKGRAVDIKQVGRELGVRYVLEGSVRKAASRVRITGQLIDATTGAHLWADRFDGGLEDVFDLQEEVTRSVVGAIAPKLEQAEIERAKRKPTEHLDAYDYYLRGIASLHQLTRESTVNALQLFYRAIELDPEFASAYGMAAWCAVIRKANGWMTDRKQETAETERLALKAMDLGRDDAIALSRGGIALAYVVGDNNSGAAFIDRALALNPNLATAWLFSGWVRADLGDTETSLRHLATAMRMSPVDPLMFDMQNAAAVAHLFAGRFEEASTWAERSLREKPDFLPSLRFAAASYAHAGRTEEAQKVVSRILGLDPDQRISNLADVASTSRPADMALLAEGLRKAGLPE
ncbi:adenylate/guanylate cyclase domain-containing protein [Mesorhizobium sp. M2A.F.Ca.ET.043.05.1.1]|uniref:adenylate/guanylate cyclase domain-containing protein n=1 Tax=Mesorhizobium sp. M2A.F.Ca.ET.043.05.1.1 TaxID=2493671 RepID=UPI000F75A81B|nr:adenylate/guanylate cyclase domain-containing protein [Mesorhizobium sp. M2A.F.Ca.ET.043.05.1.1]AZO13304.1 adenylate/guanylate cyclase domain-containing protein [Mesorhizobium sp. M2A.F.Ca.ET.043.05.1.1]